MTTQRASGRAFFPSRTRSRPERPGMRRSVMTRSKSDEESISSPSVPFRASSSLYPSSPSTVQRKERIGPSSSTIRILFDIERSPRVRKKDGENGPGGFPPIRQIDLPVHSFHRLFRVGQPQSRAIRLGGMEGGKQTGHGSRPHGPRPARRSAGAPRPPSTGSRYGSRSRGPVEASRGPPTQPFLPPDRARPPPSTRSPPPPSTREPGCRRLPAGPSTFPPGRRGGDRSPATRSASSLAGPRRAPSSSDPPSPPVHPPIAHIP